MRENIIDLIGESIKLNSFEQFNSRYTNPVHKVLEEDEKYIAHLGCDKRVLNTPNGDLNGAFLLDNVVTEDKRREGIFTKLYNEFESENEDIKLLFDFPLQYELLNLVDHQDFEIVGEVNVHAKILDTAQVMYNHSFLGVIAKFVNKIAGLKVKYNDTSKYSVRDIDDFSELNKIDMSLFKNKLMTKRTDDFLKKRIINHGDIRVIGCYKNNDFLGYLIYKFVERSGLKYYMIMDVIFEEKLIFEALVKEVIDRAKTNNISLVGIWHSDLYGDIIKRMGFNFAKSSVTIIAKDKTNSIDIKGVNNWYLQPIEGEIY